MAIDLKEALVAVRKYFLTVSPAEFRKDREKSERKLLETGIDQELRTAYLNEFGWCTLVVGYSQWSWHRSVKEIRSVFRGETHQQCGNTNTTDFLKLFTQTRVVILIASSSDDVAKVRALSVTIRERFPFVLKVLIIADDPSWFPDSDDTLRFCVFPSVESLSEAFWTMIDGKDRMPHCHR